MALHSPILAMASTLKVNNTASLESAFSSFDLETFDSLLATSRSHLAATAVSSHEDALRSVLAWSILNSFEDLKSEYRRIDERLDKLGELHDIRKLVLELYSKLGLVCIDPPGIRIADTFPAPFSGLKGRALAPDKTDQRRYGLANEMVIRRGAMTKTTAPVFVAHELVHYHVQDNGLLARGLEEAICDFLSIFCFAAQFISPRFAMNYYTSARYARRAKAQRFDLYADDMVSLVLRILSDGWDHVSNTISSGRSSLKKYEQVSIQFEKGLQIGQMDPTVRFALNLVLDILSTQPRNQIVSPQCAISLINLKEPDAIRQSPLSMEIGLAELQERIFGVLRADGKVEFEDSANLSVFSNVCLDLEI